MHRGRSNAIPGILFWLLACLSGCDHSTASPVDLSPAAAPLGEAFDVKEASQIRGRVKWVGQLPDVPPFRAPLSPGTDKPDKAPRSWLNPNVPQVDAATAGLGGAVVQLRGVDPRRSRPWNHAPVRVEMREYRLDVLQGEEASRTGILRVGDEVEMTKCQDEFESVLGRGAAFFSLAFPDDGLTRRRHLDREGVVELSSGAGHFWMRAYLFVVESPYCTRTATDGSFCLEQVPPGDYQLVCWHPHFREAGHELDTETALVTRLTFRKPVERVHQIHLRPAGADVEFTLSADDFTP